MKPLLKGVISLMVVFAIVTVVLIAAFPVSKIRIITHNITNNYPLGPETYLLSIYIDDQEKVTIRVDPGQEYAGEWQVKAGTHLVDIRWRYIEGDNPGLESVRHATYEKVEAFSTKTVQILLYR